VVYDAGDYRVAIAICKDLLDNDVRELYARLGVNLVLVPAMSSKTADFKSSAEDMVKRSQAVTVVSNALLRDAKDRPIDPAAVLGQPFLDREVLAANTQSDQVPALTGFRVGDDMPMAANAE